MHSSALYRECPACQQNAPKTLLSLKVSQFLYVNPTYRFDDIFQLGFTPDDSFDIVACSFCGFQYALNLLPAHLQQAVYSCIDAEKSLEKIFQSEKRLHLVRVWQTLFSLWSKKHKTVSNLKVFDYGCGWGDFLSVAAAPGVYCYGLEIDERKNKFSKELGVTILNSVGQIEQFAPFDLIYCDQVLEHLEDPALALRNMYAWLKPSGYGFISVPKVTRSRFKEISNMLENNQPIPKVINPWEHLNYFAPDSLINMVQSCGFSIVHQSAVLAIDFNKNFFGQVLQAQKSLLRLEISHLLDRVFKRKYDSTSLYVTKDG